MRLRTITTVCFALGTILLIGTPWIMNLNPAKLPATYQPVSHKAILAFKGLMLSYSAATLLLFVSSALFAILLIMDMQESFRADRQQNYQVFLEGAQADLTKPDESPKE